LLKKFQNKTKRLMPVYETHDNGGRAFQVRIQSREAIVSRLVESDDDDELLVADPPITTFRFLKKWIGVGVEMFSWGRPVDTAKQKNEVRKFSLGNSCLFQVSGQQYIFVGTCVISFSLPRGEVVKRFKSLVGNNDVPYPWLQTNKNVYFLIESVKRQPPNQIRSEEAANIAFVPLRHLVKSRDFYQTYYGHDGLYPKGLRETFAKPLKIQVLADAVWPGGSS
jgi:hypothetical protein